MSERITHRNFSVEPGGMARRVYGARNRTVAEEVNRVHHELVIAATEDVSTDVPAEHRQWAYDLRRGRNRVCGGVFRFLDLLYRRGFSMEVALKIPEGIERYIRAKWSKRPVEAAVPLRRVG